MHILFSLPWLCCVALATMESATNHLTNPDEKCFLQLELNFAMASNSQLSMNIWAIAAFVIMCNI